MNNSQLLALLRSRNIHCDLRPDFPYLTGFTQELGQVICVELPAQSGRHTSGISFWLHSGGGFAFLGLWSGVLYQLARPSQLADLAADLFSGLYVTKGSIPSRIPESCMIEYGLEQCEVLELTSPNPHEQLNDAKASHVLRTMGPLEIANTLRLSVDSCRLLSGRLVEARIGAARLVLRASGAPGVGHTSVGALVYPELCGTGDHLVLLEIISQQLDCALYDPVWGNRIQLDDPYYTVLDKSLRPGFPRNAVCNDFE